MGAIHQKINIVLKDEGLPQVIIYKFEVMVKKVSIQILIIKLNKLNKLEFDLNWF